MPRLSQRRLAHIEDDESYFISMSDMLTGLLFVFIILLLYFALQMRQATQELRGANDARRELLVNLKARLKSKGVKVEIDPVTGVLRLPDAILFEPASPTLSAKGEDSVRKVADALFEVLPCYTDTHVTGMPCREKPSVYRIDALFVEGHTDKHVYVRGGRDTNIDLSTQRAINTYLAIVQRQPQLDEITTNYPAQGNLPARKLPIFSVSGYGAKRPIPGHESFDERDLTMNRRIDLRFLMATPDPDRLRSMLVR